MCMLTRLAPDSAGGERCTNLELRGAISHVESAGLLLLLIGVLTRVGNTMDLLPPQAFWAGLLTYPIGGYLFFMGSRSLPGNTLLR